MNEGTAFAFFFITLFALFFGLIYYYLLTRHKERMSLIEHGADAKLFQASPQKKSYFYSMMIGVVFICLALGIGVGAILDEYVFIDYYNDDNPAPYFVSIFFFIGAGFISSFFLSKKLGTA